MKTLCLALAATTILAALPASAVVLLTSGGQLTGATGLMVNGTSYNVSFAPQTCAPDNCTSPITDEATAIAAAQALLDQVLVDGPLGQFDSDPALTFGCSDPDECNIYLVYDYDAATDTSLYLGVYNTPDEGDDEVYGPLGYAGESTYETDTYETYAYFSLSALPPADVPAPAALGLLGLGALTLAARRRRPAKV